MEHLPGRLELKCAPSTAIQTVDEYLSSSSIFWYYDYYQEEEKGQLISNFDFPMWGIQNICCLHKYSLSIWIWWIIKRDSNIFIIFGAFESTIYSEESYTLPWDSYLTFIAPGSCSNYSCKIQTLSFKLYVLLLIYSKCRFRIFI